MPSRFTQSAARSLSSRLEHVISVERSGPEAMEHWYKFRSRVLTLAAMLSALVGPASRTGAQDAGEDETWHQAQVLGTAEAYETYLRRFPLGKHTCDAYRGAVISAARPGSGLGSSFELIQFEPDPPPARRSPLLPGDPTTPPAPPVGAY
jgi:hypothetical protein